MAKNVALQPDWLKAPSVEDIFSVSGCISEDFAECHDSWKQNGYSFYDSPAVIQNIAKDLKIDLTETKLFYYEVFETQYDEEKKQWGQFAPDPSFDTDVVKPESASLEGYDIVTFSVGTIPECSPLSCNHLADEIKTNRHCLLSSLEEARGLLEQGKFDNSEPGPYQIFAVYSLEWP